MINGNPNSASDYFVRDHLKAGIMNNLIGGINRNLHSRIHSWLRNEFGRADHCEFCGINKKYNPQGRKFNYALKKDCDYDFNRENYLQLCTSCHRKYDMTDEIREKIIKNIPSQRGKIRGKHQTAKAIYSIDTNGNKEYFDSLLSACDKYNYKIANISMCLTGKNSRAYEKYWQYC